MQTCETMGKQRHEVNATESEPKEEEEQVQEQPEERCKSPVIDTPEQFSAIEAFYAEAIVLMTGATGFLGKALVEKLLRSCSRLNAIFILIRPKKGRTIEQRFTELIENPVSIIHPYVRT
jgi:FlaA1/EpsC-like NDP-sugar epimerase